MRLNRMKQTLRAGSCVIGPNLQIDHPWLVEIIGHAGFDYIMLDGEHGTAFNNLPSLIMAADAIGITPIVRIPELRRSYLNWALESGAGGVQVPMVETPEDAQCIVQETKYAPLGQRGFSIATRAADYGLVDGNRYIEQANDQVMVIVQLESAAAVTRAVEIASVPGIDMVFIGPADLAQSMGYAGNSRAKPVTERIIATIEQIRNIVHVGISAFSQDDVQFWQSHGVTSFLTSSMHPIRLAFETLNSNLRQGLKG